MTIHGLNKLTLLDYPGFMGCTVFTGHCNMRCPFCHNAPLVLFPETQTELPAEEFFDFLRKRRGLLEGVCVTGGEPTLAPDLLSFLEKIKSLGYRIKLDTNGTNPSLLREAVAEGLLDYIAMDIKSSLPHYAAAVGIPDFCTDTVQESASFLMDADIPYEFRTTTVRGLHDAGIFSAIGGWLHGARAYYLQAFYPGEDLILNFQETKKELSTFTKGELNAFLALLAPYFNTVGLRGID
ncbi:MAG: anaerobic ribonucleoside-triphosphate reductase activating protein [Lachnospiraceae bacterium]|nr:anaerobic ribonucleoside-triphosphate reductase activating protein [Lachnospiraceae bacterium]